MTFKLWWVEASLPLLFFSLVVVGSLCFFDLWLFFYVSVKTQKSLSPFLPLVWLTHALILIIYFEKCFFEN